MTNEKDAQGRIRNSTKAIGRMGRPPPLRLERIPIFIVIAALVFLSGAGVVRAAVFTFTSTADWDAGSKAPTADENLGIETITDNPGIASGVFELGSLKGDAFNTPSIDADTAKWDVLTQGTIIVNQDEIAAGVRSIDISGSLGQAFRGARTETTFSGDFDVRIKVDEGANSDGANRWLYLNVFNAAVIECTDTVTVDGLLYFISYATIGKPLALYECVDGGYGAQVGSNTNVPSDPVWLRLMRVTNTFTAYYSTDGIVWTLDETTTNANIGGNFYFQVACSINGVSTCDLDFDDYHLATGTLSSTGYRTIGNWTSASQTDPAPERITSAIVNYSGASVTNYITSFTILDALGATLFFDGTDLTGGTTQTYTVPNVTPGLNWKVRLNLTGDGTGTPTITNIDALTEAPPVLPTGCFGESTFGSILFAIFGIIAGVSIFVAIYAGLREGQFEVENYMIIIIGTVVIVAIVGAFLIAFSQGATLGC